MGDKYLTDIARVLREAGLSVIESSGWQSRARSSGGFDGNRPWCVMWHHTASDTDAGNDVAYIINADDGPLSNLYLARSGDVHVIAAGATNTNGKGKSLGFSKGTVPADSMNTHAIGIEAANNGVGQAWPQVQIDALFAINNALCSAYGLAVTDLSTHQHYAPDRKIDPATVPAIQGPWRPRAVGSSQTWNTEDIRNEAVARWAGVPGPTGGLMFTMFNMGGYGGDTYGGYMDANGIFAQITWLSPMRAEACSAAGAKNIGLISPNDLINCDLLGPVPEGTPRSIFANVIE